MQRNPQLGSVRQNSPVFVEIEHSERSHVEGELHDLEDWVVNHKEEIEAGDHHDPSPLELYCDQEPGAPECKIHDN